jgi:hypothetical protein
MIDPDIFSDEQREFLAQLVDDMKGPTSVGSVLRVLEAVIYELKPDFDLDRSAIHDEQTSKDLAVCMAALQYLKVQQAAEG